jgi:hypothetical protein
VRCWHRDSQEDVVSVEQSQHDREVGVAACPPAPLVSDVLTWRLARRVMVDHEYDVASVDGACRTCGEPWPCGAWRRAEDVANQFRP